MTRTPIVLAAAFAASAAHAGVCENLYAQRNGIFRDAGYCFHTERAIRTFGNDGCRFNDVAAVPLPADQRRVLRAIAAEEQALGCRD